MKFDEIYDHLENGGMAHLGDDTDDYLKNDDGFLKWYRKVDNVFMGNFYGFITQHSEKWEIYDDQEKSSENENPQIPVA